MLQGCTSINSRHVFPFICLSALRLLKKTNCKLLLVDDLLTKSVYFCMTVQVFFLLDVYAGLKYPKYYCFRNSIKKQSNKKKRNFLVIGLSIEICFTFTIFEMDKDIELKLKFEHLRNAKCHFFLNHHTKSN